MCILAFYNRVIRRRQIIFAYTLHPYLRYAQWTPRFQLPVFLNDLICQCELSSTVSPANCTNPCCYNKHILLRIYPHYSTVYSWSLQLLGPLTRAPASPSTELEMKYKTDHWLYTSLKTFDSIPLHALRTCLTLCLDSRIHKVIRINFRSHFNP